MLRSLPTGEERRDLTLTDAGVSVLSDDAGARRFGGHAAVFNSRTAIGNPLGVGFYEQISPGAFTKTLGESDARFLIDHSSYHVVSRASAGTLILSQDERGLAVDSALDTRLSYVNDLIANLDNGNIRGMSFGFQVVKDDWTEEEARSADGEATSVEVRTIREIKLIETSSVTFPAYEETDAGLRYSLVPALRHRGDIDAIARAALARPELAPLLGYDPALAPTVIDLGARADDPKKPYGDVTYADPGYQKDGKKRYPIDTEEHAKAAWSYINQAKNAGNYTAEQLASIKSKIKAALKKFGVDVSDDGRALEAVPTDSPATEPAETTRDSEDASAPLTEDSEPAASTRDFESEQYMAKARARALALRLSLVA